MTLLLRERGKRGPSAVGPTKRVLRADGLECTETRGVHQRHYVCESETGLLQERPIFRIRSFHAPDVDQHLQVKMKHAHRLTMMWRDCPLDEEDFRCLHHGRAAVSQDRQRSIVVPIMDYLSQNVEVSARRQRIKKASADNLAAVAYARILEDLTGARHDSS